jgi:hypothetical protein
MKRVLTVFVVTILFSLLPFNIIASAAEDEPGTRFQYISSCSSTLTTSGTTATGISKVTGYNGETTKIVITQTLQRKNSYGNWVYVQSYSGTYYYFKATLSKTYSNLSSGTYRLKSVFTVYAGSNSETVTKYSSEKTI